VSHYHSFRQRWQQARWQCITSRIIIRSLCDIDIVSQCDCFYTADSGTLKWWQSCVKTALKIKIQSAVYWFGNQKLWIGAKLIKSISRSEAYFDVTIYQKFLKAYLSRVFTSFLLKYQLQSKIYWQTEIDTLDMHRMESKTLREDQNWVRYGQVSKWLMVSKGVVNDCIRMYLVLFPNKKQVSFPPSFVLWTSLSLSPSPPLLFSFQHAIVLLTVLPPCLPLFTYCTPKTFDNRPMVSHDHGKVGWLTTALCRTWDTNKH